MGTDKAALRRAGLTLARRATDDLAAQGLAPVALVGSSGAGDLGLAPGIAAVADRYPGEGPLGGIITALRWSPAAWCVVVPCDVVEWQPSRLVPMLLTAAIDARDVDVAVLATTGGVEPLYACWHRPAVAVLEPAFDDGLRAPRDALELLRAVRVTVPATDVPLSVNTPGDAAAAGLDDATSAAEPDGAGMHGFGGDDR